jgi:hypothetical protein
LTAPVGRLLAVPVLYVKRSLLIVRFGSAERAPV